MKKRAALSEIICHAKLFVCSHWAGNGGQSFIIWGEEIHWNDWLFLDGGRVRHSWKWINIIIPLPGVYWVLRRRDIKTELLPVTEYAVQHWPALFGLQVGTQLGRTSWGGDSRHLQTPKKTFPWETALCVWVVRTGSLVPARARSERSSGQDMRGSGRQGSRQSRRVSQDVQADRLTCRHRLSRSRALASCPARPGTTSRTPSK